MPSRPCSTLFEVRSGFHTNSAWRKDSHASPSPLLPLSTDRVDGLGDDEHELGLLSFDHRIEPLLALTSTLSLFESVIDDIEKRGSTEIYEAIIGAATMLQAAADADPPRLATVADAADAAVASVDPKAAGAAGAASDASAPPTPPVALYARILVLTDGVSSNHGASATTALAAARSVGAVVDAIIVGSRPDEKLRKIVTATGCVPRMLY